ncbi:flagellar assembly protein FliW [Fusibacter sp. JL216-2]|uniref:flagellar assembly protein FliW n=1 Tax=Fusibacter sp. JL216-2 TaxID=3071453 RepID=UPI003D352C0E
MIISTTNFGNLDIEEDMVITFDEGLPGFEDEHEFVILNNWDTEDPVGFMWLQSTKNEDLAFVVSIPFLLKSDYEFEIPEEVCQKMNLKDPSQVGVYTVCKINNRVDDMTFNLASPIIVNAENRKAIQLTLNDKRYRIKETLK